MPHRLETETFSSQEEAANETTSSSSCTENPHENTTAEGIAPNQPSSHAYSIPFQARTRQIIATAETRQEQQLQGTISANGPSEEEEANEQQSRMDVEMAGDEDNDDNNAESIAEDKESKANKDQVNKAHCDGKEPHNSDDSDDDESAVWNLNPKRFKSVTDDLICPISLELPFDPVIAEDGRVYDRRSIEQCFQGKTDEEITSPMTNEPMGKKLLPAVQHKNLIQSLIDAGVIAGKVAGAWKARALMIQKAHHGDRNAMFTMGLNYYRGENGFQLDGELAFHWFQKAHRAGHVQGTAMLGACLCKGTGCNASHVDGLHYLTCAAERGSDFGAYWMGLEKLGQLEHSMLLRDPMEAAYWFQKAVDPKCPHPHLKPTCKEDARKKLRELLQSK